MTETTAQFLALLFNKGEEICVSHNKYGYHSIPQEAIGDSITLISPNQEYGPSIIKESDINLIAVNPIKGFRKDENVTTFRSFMLEIDTGSLQSQRDYIDQSGLPYSVCVFSGNKSLHFAVVLEEALPSIEMWRFYNQWLLNVLSLTDQQIKNPSRNLRFPGNQRKNGKKLLQALVEMRTRVSQETFFKWLYSHEDQKPIQRREREASVFTGVPDITKIPSDVMSMLSVGIEDNRNSSWFYVGCRFASAGFDLPSTTEFLNQYFTEDKDFKEREWKMCLKSAFKRVNGDIHGED